MTKVMVSGGFDPLHVGHLDLIEQAAKFGEVYVALNTDEWLIDKKGYCVMKWKDRCRILMALESVQSVFMAEGSTVDRGLRFIKPDIFANGGDRDEANKFEHAACIELGIAEAFNVGGKKRRSSSALVENPLKKVREFSFRFENELIGYKE